MLGFPILYCKGMRPMMFQLSGFCYKLWGFKAYTAWGLGFCRSVFRFGQVSYRGFSAIMQDPREGGSRGFRV